MTLEPKQPGSKYHLCNLLTEQTWASCLTSLQFGFHIPHLSQEDIRFPFWGCCKIQMRKYGKYFAWCSIYDHCYYLVESGSWWLKNICACAHTHVCVCVLGWCWSFSTFKRETGFCLESDFPGSHFTLNHQLLLVHSTYFYFILTEWCLV